MLMNSLVLAMTPMFVMTVIFNTAPFWASLISFMVLGDSVTKFELAAMVCSFSGVLMLGYNGLLKQ